MTTTEIKEVGENRTGKYYQLNLRTKGQMVAPIVVKHSTRFDTMVCLSCVSADTCAHSRLVRQYVEDHATEPAA
jgi:hypothetical protein